MVKIGFMTHNIKGVLMICIIAASTFVMSHYALSQSNQKRNTTAKKAEAKSGDATYVSGITPGRARSLIGGVVGLACLVLGWRAKNRSRSANSNIRTTAAVALILGSIGIVLSVVHLISTAGAVFGSGSGKAGAIVALGLSCVGMVLAALALSNEKRNG